MKRLLLLVILLSVNAQCRAAQRAIFVGFDFSATAFQSGSNPYHAGWVQILSSVQGGDHVYAEAINEHGFGSGAPPIDFTIRPYNFFSDKRSDYEAAVQAKLKRQEMAFDAMVHKTVPARGTEIIGFLHTVATILAAYPTDTNKVVILWTDSMEESREVNIARAVLSDADIKKIIETERHAGRMPALSGMNVLFVTGASMHGQVSTNHMLRLEAFWREYIRACGGTLRAFSPVLANF